MLYGITYISGGKAINSLVVGYNSLVSFIAKLGKCVANIAKCYYGLPKSKRVK